MADNYATDLSAGTGETFASDDNAGTQYPYVKLAWGANGVYNLLSNASGKALPISLYTPLGDSLVDDTNDAVKITQTDATLLAATATGAAAENAAAAGNPVLSGGRYDSSARTLGNGDVGAIALDVNGHVITSGHAGSVALSDNVSNTVNVAVDEAEAFMGTATFPFMFDGTAWDRVRGDATNGMLVNLGANNDVVVTNAGTFATQATLQAGTAEIGKLAAGTASIGTLGANSGVDIGDVDVTSVIPGTGATNLGKAIDSVVGATDTGVALLAKHKEDQLHLTSADGDYDILSLDSLGSVHVNAESHHVFDDFNATTGWTALGNDTLNLATTTKHCLGTNALTFDKVNGAANTVFGAIQKTLTSVDIGAVSPHDIIQGVFYFPDIADVNYAFLRLGTDSSNYNEWRIDAGNLTAGVFETGALSIGDADHTGITGNGWDPSAITYIAVGAAFNTETDTLAGIIFDEISYHTNQHSSASINSEVTSSISSANVNISKVGNKVVNTQAGNVSTGTQRITIADDDTNLSGILTGVQLIDDAVYADDAAFTLTSSKVMAGGGMRDDTLTTLSAVEGDIVPFRVSSTGALHVTGGGGGTEYSISDAAPTVVSMAGTIRDDTLTTLTEADGDASTLRVNSTGALHVTGGGGGTEYVVDDAAGATPTGTTTVMERDDALSTLTPIAGDWNHFRSNARGALWVELDTTNEMTVALSSVDNAVLDQIEVNTSFGDSVGAGTEAAALRVTLATDSTGLLSIDDNGGSLTIDNAQLSVVGGGTEAAAMRVTIANDSTGLISIDDNGGSLTVDNGGTFAVQAGQAAHDAAISGNPVRIGGTARNASATAVGNGDQVDLTADLEGKLVTSPHAVKEDFTDGATAAVTGTSNTSIIAAQGAGIRTYITSIQVFNSHATVGTVTEIKDGTTVKHRGYAREDGGGYTAEFPVPIQCTANTAVNGANITTGSNTYFNVQGYKAA